MNVNDFFNEMYGQPNQREPFFNYVALRQAFEQFMHSTTCNASAHDFFHFLLTQYEPKPGTQLISADLLQKIGREVNNAIEHRKKLRESGNPWDF